MEFDLGMGYNSTAVDELMVGCLKDKNNLARFIRNFKFSALKKKPANEKYSPSNDDILVRRCGALTSSKLIAPSLITGEDLEVIELIGYGDLGKVYLTRDKNTGKLYATKVISKRKAIHRNKVSRILTEQRVLLTLNHPFLARLYHSFHNNYNVYFVMEYCAGGELFRRLQSLPTKSVSEEQAKFYAAEVLCALEYLHLMGFIYRDLKPENILLSEDGHVVLSDFDLSRSASNKDLSEPLPPKMIRRQFTKILSSSSSSILQLDTRSCTGNISASSFVGTEEYISPEIIAHKTHTSAVDWWALGIFIYELVHGYSPFKGPTKHATFDNIMSAEVVFRVTLSNKCKRIIRSLLQKDPGRRLGSSTGASEIKLHPFFEGIVWGLLRNCKPPQIWDINPGEISKERAKNGTLNTFCDPIDSTEDLSLRPEDAITRGSRHQAPLLANPSPPISSHSNSQKHTKFSKLGISEYDPFSEVLSVSLSYNT